MKIYKRSQFYVSSLRWFGYLFVKPYHYKAKKVKLEKNKPYLFICNHTCNADPVLVQTYINRVIHFVAHYELMESFSGKIVDHMFGVIPKIKGKSDLHMIREASSVIKQNGIVGLFPSGDCTFDGIESPIDKSIVKFVRLMKADTILYQTHGLYGVDPRFSNKKRKGASGGELKRILTVDEIKAMSDDELFDAIMNVISVNHYEVDIPPFKSKKKAEYLERILYICPDCGSVSSLSSDGNIISCNKCGYRATYKEDLTLNLLKGEKEFKTIYEWVNFEKEEVGKLDSDNFLFSDSFKKLKINKKDNKREIIKGGTIYQYKDKFIINTQDKTIEFPLSELQMIFHSKKRLVIYHGDDVYNVNGFDRFCGMKYIHYLNNYVQD